MDKMLLYDLVEDAAKSWEPRPTPFRTISMNRKTYEEITYYAKTHGLPRSKVVEAAWEEFKEGIENAKA